MDIGHLAPEITMVVGALIALMTASFIPRHRQGVPAAIAVVAAVGSAVAALGLAANTDQQLSFDRAWAFDDVTHTAEVLIAVITVLVLVMSVRWFVTDPRRGEYPSIVMLSAAGAMLLAGADDTMEIVVGMLLVSVTGYTLAAYHRGSPASVEAGMKYFLIGALTNALLMIGVGVLYGATGTTNLADIAVELDAHADAVALIAVVVCIGIGLAFEIGAVPAHMWVPDVAQAAPAPSAAFLTVVPKIGALVAMSRVFQLLPDGVVAWRPVLAIMAAATMTLGNLAALWQTDVRRLLGWSSVSQAGYALMAAVVVGRSDHAVPALMMFLVAYAFANTAAFAVVTELRGRTDLDDYRGLGSARPWLATIMTISMLSLVGVPPLGGFVGKLSLFTAVIDGGYAWLAVLAAANTVGSLFYYLRVIGPMYFDPATDQAPVPVLGRWAGVAASIALAAVIGVGLLAEPLLDALESARLLP